MNMQINPFELLGVSPDADRDQMESAYKQKIAELREAEAKLNIALSVAIENTDKDNVQGSGETKNSAPKNESPLNNKPDDEPDDEPRESSKDKDKDKPVHNPYAADKAPPGPSKFFKRQHPGNTHFDSRETVTIKPSESSFFNRLKDRFKENPIRMFSYLAGLMVVVWFIWPWIFDHRSDSTVAYDGSPPACTIDYVNRSNSFRITPDCEFSDKRTVSQYVWIDPASDKEFSNQRVLRLNQRAREKMTFNYMTLVLIDSKGERWYLDVPLDN
jgi:hypothetical protein